MSGTPGLSTVRSLIQPRGSIPDHRYGRHLVGGQLRLPQPGQRHLDDQQVAVDRDGRLEDQELRGNVAALTATLSGFVNGDTPSVVSGAPALTTAATAASHVTGSSYPVFVSVGSLWAANYSFVFVNGTLSLNPAPLTITANNAGMIQGTAVPPLSVNYNGFVNGDSPANLATQPTVTTPATPFSPAGAYPIVAGGASSPNYAINYASGVLVVTPAPVRVLSVSIQAVRLGKTKKTTQVIVLQFSGSLNAGGAQASAITVWQRSPATRSRRARRSPCLKRPTTLPITL